jgi:CRISPR-associated protein Cas2
LRRRGCAKKVAGRKEWYLICYDIRDPARWRKAYKLLLGYGQRIQYSIFRSRLTKKEVEKIRLDLSDILDDVDSLLILVICNNCATRIPTLNRPDEWSSDDDTHLVI